ncbi:MAG TPA: hypothetical protein VNW15_10710 [Rhizomicrobium sp.]|nr:hypothetical protein [Rhizomicrobium sp.]
MSAVDGHGGADARPILNVELPLAGIVGIAAALLALGTMVLYGFHDSGVRFASELAWRFASFVFFVAIVAGPLCHLIPLAICKSLGPLRRQLIWSFCASYAVFLASLLLPNAVGGVTHDEATAGMTVFSLFGAATIGVMAYAASDNAVALVGERSRNALLSVAMSFFWLTYALTGLAHLSGPHRPDSFYGASLSLMILALLLRFSDRFIAKFRGTLDTSVL